MLPASLASFLLVALSARAAVLTNASIPKIDFAALGLVAIAGNFAGLQLYDPAYQESLRQLNVAADRQTLWSRATDGHLTPLGSTDIGGSISSICANADGLVFLTGNFTTIGTTTAANIASFDPSLSAFNALGQGLNGPGQTLFCSQDQLFVGGSFTAPTGATTDEGYAGAVATWTYSSASWSPLPFNGLNGAVTAIEGSSPGSSIFFGGNFTYSISNSSSPSTSTNPNSANIPSLGSSLTPIPLGPSYTWAGDPTSSTSITGTGDPYAVFCPQGDGSSGTAWLAPDNTASIFVVRLYTPLQAGGLRIGNTFVDGRGTRQFKVISVPDSIVQTLTYYSDPTNPNSPLATCDFACPLSNDASIPYQDFLFSEGTNLTGFQIDVDQWYGSGGGFHQISLLSDGSYAYAVDSLNSNSSAACTTGSAVQTPSSSTTSGTWIQQSVPSDIDGVEAQVLVANVVAGATSPSITFNPSIVANGGYDAFLLTPGCLNMGDCGLRTVVQVTISNGAGSTSTATVDQRNQYDQSSLVYSGALESGTSFQMSLANPSTGNVQLVANKVNLVAQNSNAAMNQANARGKGLFEFVPSGSTGVFSDGAAASSQRNLTSSALTNATGFDNLSILLANQSTAIVNAIVYEDDFVFFGGRFATAGNISTSNIAAYTGSSSRVNVPNGGLNDEVNALLALDGYLYAAGRFTASSDATVDNLAGVARWQYTSSSAIWEALSGSNTPEFPNGAQGLAAGQSNGDDAVLVSGSTDGFSVFNTKQGTWDSTGNSFFVGNLTTIGSTAPDSPSYIAGSIDAALQFSASGIARMVTNSSGAASILPYDFDFVETRSVSARSLDVSLPQIGKTLLQKRAPPATSINLPSAYDASASNQIVAGTFFKNGSDYSVILGGSFTSGSCSNLGIYSTATNSLNCLDAANQINGVVQALEVADDTLFIGGSFTTSQRGGDGLAVYNLKSDQWASSPPALVAYDSADVSVTSILVRQDNSIIVGGAFSAAGSLPCFSVCLWNSKASQWTSFGSGLNGIVSSMTLAGDERYLYAAGRFVVDSQTVSVARWDFQESSWSLLGSASDLPGPATALSTDGSSEDSLFVAGGTVDTESQPFFVHWNGSVWTDVNQGSLSAGSRISQLALLPLSNTHDGQVDILDKDRMIMLSGALNLDSVGTVSGALFDGANFTPFVTTATSDGGVGSLASLFFSASSFQTAARYLSVGIVILISIAIGLGIVFFLVLIGLFFALRHRHTDNDAQNNGKAFAATESEKTKHRPSSLLATLNAATALISADKSASHTQQLASESSSTLGHPTGGLAYDADTAEGDYDDFVRTRWSFDAENPGELTVGANEEVKILDRTDDSWWFVENEGGKRGVVPSAYLF